MSTTPDDKDSATEILTIENDRWRNFWSPSGTHESSSHTLTAGEHYYIKVIQDAEGSDPNYINLGFTIDDESTPVENSFHGFSQFKADPGHTFESFELTIPNNPDVSYKLKFDGNSPDCKGVTDPTMIFEKCTWRTCPCTTFRFSSESTTEDFKDRLKAFFSIFRGDYGRNLDVQKEEITQGGSITAYKFIVTGKVAREEPSFNGISLFSKDSSTDEMKMADEGTDYNFTMTAARDLTSPLQGKYKIEISQTGGGSVETDDFEVSAKKEEVLKEIYDKVPFLLGKVDLKDSDLTFPTSDEGRELFWRMSEDASDYSLTFKTSSTEPLSIESHSSQNIQITNDDTFLPSSNKPFYEVIPSSFLRTVEDAPQITVSTNGILGACPVKGGCSFSFSPLSGDISGYTLNADNTKISVTGTSIPFNDVTFVEVGCHRCLLDPSVTHSATSLS